MRTRRRAEAAEQATGADKTSAGAGSKRAGSKAETGAKAKRSRKAGGVKVAAKKAEKPKRNAKSAAKRSSSLRKAAERVREAMPQIVDTMVSKALKGNVQHLKTLLDVTGVKEQLQQQCQPQPEASLAELLLRELGEEDRKAPEALNAGMAQTGKADGKQDL